MTEDFKKICLEQYNRGVRNKGDKQSPSQTLELIKERFPGLYCYPGINEILRTYQSFGNQPRKAGEQATESKKQAAVSPEIKAELQMLLNEDSTLTGGKLFKLWEQRCRSNHADYESDKVRKQANYLRAKLLKGAKIRLKRAMAG